MNYYFTGGLIILFVLLCFIKPAYPRNEYLNNGTNTCSTGDLSLSVEQRDSENSYRHFNADNNYTSPSDDRSLRLTWRHYLGSACTDEFKAVQQENMELKQKLFSEWDKIAPAKTIFASNTSSLPISEIAATTSRADRFGGLHFFNPVPVMKLLEVVRIPQTSDETYNAMSDWGQALGKATVECKDTHTHRVVIARGE